MNRRAFLRFTSASVLAYACRGVRAPTSAIRYGDPNALPPHVAIEPGWIEHRQPYPEATAAYRWTDIILEACAREVEATGVPRVTVISRHMAIACTAMYDAWACYDATAIGTRLAGSLRRPVTEHTIPAKTIAIGHAVYHALLALFPADAAWLAGQMRALHLDPGDTSKDPATPQGIGRLVADALIGYRSHDGSNMLGDEIGGDGTPYSDYTFYEPRTTRDPNRWQPITFEDGKTPGFLTAHWYRVKLLALDRSDQFRPGPQPLVGSPRLRDEVAECIAFNGGLSLEQKSIVEFMRDGPRSTGQSGHWLEFARDVSRRDHADLDRDVKLFFVVANTAFEAFVAAWDAKRRYDSSRPYALVRLVQELFAGTDVIGYLGPGKGFGTIRAEQWKPYSPGTFITPPFPGYVSGHSTVSGACAKMLELFTGGDAFGVYHHHTAGMATEPNATAAAMQAMNGVPAVGLPADKHVVIALPTFTATAELAGISRVMGGYHIQTDNVEGLRLGRSVATFAWPRYQAYFAGTAQIRA
ncbi:MAG: vanadium-dependent haloperoxidase [Kofleriaceae bacterium]